MSAHRHSTLQEGMDAGILGGLAVALWFLVLDVAQGRPFFTPSVLGQVIIFGSGEPQTAPPVFGAILLYTVLHFVAFVAFAVLVSYLVHLGVVHAFWRYALLALFIVFELAFYFVTYVMYAATRELFPLWSVLAANTLAAVCMGIYFWRRHPALRRELDRTPLGAEPTR